MKGFSYSFGIEEEYFLCSAVTGELIERMPETLLASAQGAVDATVTSELLQSQIEIASPVFYDGAEAQAAMRRSRRALADVAQSMGLRLIAAGTHPLGAWHDQVITESTKYDRLMSDFRIVSQRNLVCGLHVHVAVPETIDRVDVMNRAMAWLPLFLALSTSSPFWNGRITGLLSYRQALYDEWPRSGIPDFFTDERDYDAFVDRLQRGGAIKDASQLWWAIRPALRYPTLECALPTCVRISKTRSRSPVCSAASWPSSSNGRTWVDIRVPTRGVSSMKTAGARSGMACAPASSTSWMAAWPPRLSGWTSCARS
jgi:carboxylate-amine ligase